MNHLAERLLNNCRRPLFESEAIKSLAKANRAVLKNVINLFQMYRGDDPHLQSKEADICMRAVLQHATSSAAIQPELFQFGRPSWEPDPLAWMSFFDQIGDRTLADFLGISSASEIPAADDMSAQIDELPEDDQNDTRRDHDTTDQGSLDTPRGGSKGGSLSDATLEDPNIGDV